ncbi:ADP-ribosylglycohydrolase family protein [Kocuria sp.]|uniref:ADP-ribosylglycohydrolase family protein n=1 Tax=Kocuria sp. TaxID=1871328 RepID=UPI0026DC0EC0|nr:ADP-ribosylglycohydrolase family protein [Kocuria sp.]MDO4918552.1 hypothetical protein [Kocuria sp.]
MTAEETPELLHPDRGLDAADERYSHLARSVLIAPWTAAGGRTDEATQLAARTAGALNEVARWANDGQAADPTACAWLAYLRWAEANGAQLPEDAPHPPADDFERHHPALARPGEHRGDSFTALATGALGEVARPVLPRAQSPEVLARTAVYGLLPTVGWKPLVALAVDSAAITHGSPEAQTAAVTAALAVHAAVEAAHASRPGRQVPLGHVVFESVRVSALVTRPAPLTRELLERCCDPAARAELLEGAYTGTAPQEAEAAASYALALGLAALLTAAESNAPQETGTGDDVARRACERLPGDSVVLRAARTLAVTVAAARWGLGAAASARPAPDDHAEGAGQNPAGAEQTAEDDEVRQELLALAEEWNGLWRS